MTSISSAHDRHPPATDPAIAKAITTVRRNAATFGARYPDDTTTDGRYEVRPAAGKETAGSTGWLSASSWVQILASVMRRTVAVGEGVGGAGAKAPVASIIR